MLLRTGAVPGFTISEVDPPPGWRVVTIEDAASTYLANIREPLRVDPHRRMDWFSPGTRADDGCYYGQVAPRKEIRDLWARVSRSDRAAGALGILPKGLMQAVRPDWGTLPEHERKAYGRESAEVEGALRRTLVWGGFRTARRWTTTEKYVSAAIEARDALAE
jgi:hypothetical protein